MEDNKMAWGKLSEGANTPKAEVPTTFKIFVDELIQLIGDKEFVYFDEIQYAKDHNKTLDTIQKYLSRARIEGLIYEEKRGYPPQRKIFLKST